MLCRRHSAQRTARRSPRSKPARERVQRLLVALPSFMWTCLIEFHTRSKPLRNTSGCQGKSRPVTGLEASMRPTSLPLLVVLLGLAAGALAQVPTACQAQGVTTLSGLAAAAQAVQAACPVQQASPTCSDACKAAISKVGGSWTWGSLSKLEHTFGAIPFSSHSSAAASAVWRFVPAQCCCHVWRQRSSAGPAGCWSGNLLPATQAPCHGIATAVAELLPTCTAPVSAAPTSPCTRLPASPARCSACFQQHDFH